MVRRKHYLACSLLYEPMDMPIHLNIVPVNRTCIMVADGAVHWLGGEVLPNKVICHSNNIQLCTKTQRTQ